MKVFQTHTEPLVADAIWFGHTNAPPEVPIAICNTLKGMGIQPHLMEALGTGHTVNSIFDHVRKVAPLHLTTEFVQLPDRNFILVKLIDTSTRKDRWSAVCEAKRLPSAYSLAWDLVHLLPLLKNS